MRVIRVKRNTGDKGISLVEVFRNMFEIPAFKIQLVRKLTLKNFRFENAHKMDIILLNKYSAKQVQKRVPLMDHELA